MSEVTLEPRIRAMSHILFAYSTTDGHTIRICNCMRETLEAMGHQVSVLPLAQADDAIVLDKADRIVIGASIRYGKHQPQVAEFIQRHQALLEAKRGAFFTVNIVARKPEKNTPQTNPYLQKFLRQIKWQPSMLGVFAGKLDYPRYRPLDRLMIRFIMLITKGPTDPRTVVEFTNWAVVQDYARALVT